MSNPQGPDRRREDATEQTGELPAWGQTPPGGWGAPDDPGSTGAWPPDPDTPHGWAGQGAADAGWDPDTARRDPGRDAGWNPDPDPTSGWGPDPAPTGGWDPAPTGGRDAAPGTGGRDAGGTGGWDAAGAGGWDAGGDAGRWAGPDADPGGTTRAAPLWGDDAAGPQDGGAVPTGRRGRRRAPDPAEADAGPEAPPPAWAGAPPADPAERAWDSDPWDAPPGDEPWAPRENVRSPRTGPFGLGAKVWGLVAAAVVVLAVVAVTAFVTPGWAVTRYLDQTALQNGVTQVLSQDYGLGVGAVRCPDDVVVSAGTEFSCQAVVDGEQVEVPGVVTSDEGDYQVNRV